MSTDLARHVGHLLADTPGGMTAAELAEILDAPIDALEAVLRAGPFARVGSRRRAGARGRSAYVWQATA